ncbi:hypothetical protein CEXT_534161 [Caerostris extrusa]|uniref:Uncharacterized protein n=1 Tax=Caerostris extrusa TaxID=172846 RepID=A0AAV4QRW6_CAEEX|nr:hypothetical protein CEXT_534161 [Caerostris extrusa]
MIQFTDCRRTKKGHKKLIPTKEPTSKYNNNANQWQPFNAAHNRNKVSRKRRSVFKSPSDEKSPFEGSQRQRLTPIRKSVSIERE